MENLEILQSISSSPLSLDIKPGILEDSDLLKPFSEGSTQSGSFKDSLLANDLLPIQPATFTLDSGTGHEVSSNISAHPETQIFDAVLAAPIVSDILLGNSPSASTVTSDGLNSVPLLIHEMTVALAISAAKARLNQFLSQSELLAQLDQAFGNSWNHEAGQALLQGLAESQDWPEIKILTNGELIANGAYSKDTNTIYLSKAFLDQNASRSDVVSAVLLEELGHYIDSRLNSVDSAGDEGAIFAALVQGRALSDADLSNLRSEDDTGTLFDGLISIEMNTDAGTLDSSRNYLINGLGTPPDFQDSLNPPSFGENYLYRNDDRSSGFIDITSVFESGINFFGTVYTGFYVNNNGNITFNAPLSMFTPFAMTGDTDIPIIAPFFSDIDTRAGALTPSLGGTSTGSNLVYWDLDPLNNTVTVTWDDVGSYSYNQTPNAFQLQLSDRGNGDFSLEFRYEAIQWVSPGGGGGPVARAGYSAANGVNYYELPQSGDAAAMLNLASTSNANQPGAFKFAVLNGVPSQAPTDILLSSARVDENAANGTVVGTLSTVDPDAGDTHVYTLLDNAGGRFAIDGTQRLVVANGKLLDYESGASHTIVVRTTDAVGLTYEKSFVIAVGDVDEPDLYITAASANKAVVSSDEVFSVSWTVENQGVGGTIGSWVDSVYLSKDATWDSSDRLIMSESSSALAPGGRYDQSRQLILPGDVDDGDYHLLWVTDRDREVIETDKANNFASTSIKLISPDLQVVSPKVPSKIIVDQLTTLSWTVKNLSAGSTLTSWKDAVYISDSAVFDSSAVRLETTLKANPTALGAAGSADTYTQTATIMLSAADKGQKYLFFVADVDGQQKDADVANNVLPVSVIVEEDVSDDELADIFDYLGYGIDLASVNFVKKVLPDGSVVVQVGDREIYVSPVGWEPSVDSPRIYTNSPFSTGSPGSWTAFGFGPSYPSGPGVPGEPPEEKFYIQSIDANNFSVIYDRVDLEGDEFAHKPVRIETAFGNVNFTYYSASDATKGIVKGDFASTDDIELFEVLLNSVGAKSVDDLSDIFVTRAFTKSGTITKEETALKNRIANLWTRIGYIALMPNIGIETLTAEERKRLLDFEENLLAATALTDEFRGYGFKEDALLLGEMVQLGRVYASLNPQLKQKDKPADGGSTPPPPEKPDALLLTTSYSYLAEDYIAIESRLKQLGYNVITKNSADFTQADADGMELIVAADYSGPINLEFAGLEVPVVVLDNRKLDSLALAAASQTVVSSPVWVDALGYLGPDYFIGELVLHKEDVPDQTVTLMNPTTLDLNLGVKSFLGGLSYSTIYANVQGDTYYDGQVPEARRVAFIGFVDSFTYLNDAGLQAFDAAIKWSANLKEPEEPEKPTAPEEPSSETGAEFDYNFFLSTLWRSEGKEAFDKATAELDTLLDEFNSSDEIVEWLNFEQILLKALGQDAETKEVFSDERVAVGYADWAVLYSQAKLQEKPYVIANDIGLFDDLWNARNSSFGENLQVSISEMLKQSVEIAQSIIPQPDPTACAFIDCSDTEVPRVVQDIGIGVAAFLITIPFPVVGVVLGGLSAGLNIGQAITGEDLAGNELTLRERIEKATTGVAEGALELIALSEGRRLFSSVVEQLRGLSRTGELTEETASIAVRDALSRVDDILGYPTRSLGAEFNNLEVVLRADPELVADLGQRIGTNRFSAGDIARIRRAPEGVAPESGIVFLEIGTTEAEAAALNRAGGAGLRHILEEHARDFASANPPIPVEKIPDAVMVAVTEGQVVGRQNTRDIYEFFFEGRRHRMAVQVGSNGFIVGANPSPLQ